MTDLAALAVGDRLPRLEKRPDYVQLFRYSAITWNAHRIHYDPEYARTEGHPDVLVQQHFHAAVVQQQLMQWLGADGRLTALEWQNVGRALPGEPLYAEAEITAIDPDDRTVTLEVWTRNDEDRCAEGTATVTVA